MGVEGKGKGRERESGRDGHGGTSRIEYGRVGHKEGERGFKKQIPRFADAPGGCQCCCRALQSGVVVDWGRGHVCSQGHGGDHSAVPTVVGGAGYVEGSGRQGIGGGSVSRSMAEERLGFKERCPFQIGNECRAQRGRWRSGPAFTCDLEL